MNDESPSGYTPSGIRHSFSKLEKSYGSGRMDDCTNYIPVRLVTPME